MIRVAIVGVGNCASALLQGLEYYQNAEKNTTLRGLMEPCIGPYGIDSIHVVLAFDVDSRKINCPLKDAIYRGNNCCYEIVQTIRNETIVLAGPILDGVSEHMKDSFCPVDAPVASTPEDMARILQDNNIDVLVNYLLDHNLLIL
jgi:myo-inositol-1-phosphate synthase